MSPFPALSLVRKLGTTVAQTLVEEGFRARRAATHITLTDVPRLDSFSCLLWMLSIPSHIFDSGSESSITTRFSFNHSSQFAPAIQPWRSQQEMVSATFGHLWRQTAITTATIARNVPPAVDRSDDNLFASWIRSRTMKATIFPCIKPTRQPHAAGSHF